MTFSKVISQTYFILMWVLHSEQGEQLCDFCMCVSIYEVEYICKLLIIFAVMMIMRALTAKNGHVALDHIFLPQAILI